MDVIVCERDMLACCREICRKRIVQIFHGVMMLVLVVRFKSTVNIKNGDQENLWISQYCSKSTTSNFGYSTV